MRGSGELFLVRLFLWIVVALPYKYARRNVSSRKRDSGGWWKRAPVWGKMHRSSGTISEGKTRLWFDCSDRFGLSVFQRPNRSRQWQQQWATWTPKHNCSVFSAMWGYAALNGTQSHNKPLCKREQCFCWHRKTNEPVLSRLRWQMRPERHSVFLIQPTAAMDLGKCRGALLCMHFFCRFLSLVPGRTTKGACVNIMVTTLVMNFRQKDEMQQIGRYNARNESRQSIGTLFSFPVFVVVG